MCWRASAAISTSAACATPTSRRRLLPARLTLCPLAARLRRAESPAGDGRPGKPGRASGRAPPRDASRPAASRAPNAVPAASRLRPGSQGWLGENPLRHLGAGQRGVYEEQVALVRGRRSPRAASPLPSQEASPAASTSAAAQPSQCRTGGADRRGRRRAPLQRDPPALPGLPRCAAVPGPGARRRRGDRSSSCLSLEHLAQGRPRPRELALRGARRDAAHGGDLLVGKLLDIVQQERLAVAGRGARPPPAPDRRGVATADGATGGPGRRAAPARRRRGGGATRRGRRWTTMPRSQVRSGERQAKPPRPRAARSHASCTTSSAASIRGASRRRAVRSIAGAWRRKSTRNASSSRRSRKAATTRRSSVVAVRSLTRGRLLAPDRHHLDGAAARQRRTAAGDRHGLLEVARGDQEVAAQRTAPRWLGGEPCPRRPR